MTDWRAEEATNQTRFRDINESTRLDPGSDGSGPWNATLDLYVCECGDATCREPISLSHDEYEVVRSDSTWFAVVLNHENPEIDRVVVEFERYAVIQKAFAEAVKIARQTDARAARVPTQALRSEAEVK